MSSLENTVEQIRKLIVEKLNIRMPAARLEANTPLFAGGVGLNSFAVVELIGLVEQRFRFQFDEDDLREEYFQSMNTLAQLVGKYESAAASLRHVTGCNDEFAPRAATNVELELKPGE